MRPFLRARRLAMAAFLVIGLLASSSVAFALPSDPGDPCFPQRVTGADAELLGTLRQLEAAEVGLPTRFSMQSPSVRIPDPKCEGQYLSVPLVFSWSVVSRPAGSVAQLTSTNTLVARLVPDVAGAWQVAFTACPTGCRVTGTTLTVPPLRQTMSVTATDGVERHVTSDNIDGLLFGALAGAGARIQVSHTGAGTNINGTPYDVAYFPLSEMYKKLCMDIQDPTADCDRLEDQMTSHVTFHTITPSFSSFLDLGPQKLDSGEIKDIYMVLPVEPVEIDVPTWLRAVILGLQHLSNLVGAIDVDRIRGLANDINLQFNRNNMWDAFIADGAINLQMHFDSEHPTIKCEGHFTKKVGFIFTIDSGWADDLCPDYDLSQMDMTIKLVPGVENGVLTLAGAQVDVQLTPANTQSELIDSFRDLSSRYSTKVSQRVHDKLLEPDNRAKIGSVLTKLLKNQFPDIGTMRSTQINGSDWVIRYTPAPPSGS